MSVPVVKLAAPGASSRPLIRPHTGHPGQLSGQVRALFRITGAITPETGNKAQARARKPGRYRAYRVGGRGHELAIRVACRGREPAYPGKITYLPARTIRPRGRVPRPP